MGNPLSILFVSSSQEEVFHMIREMKADGFSPLYQIVSSFVEWENKIQEEDWDAVIVSFRWSETQEAMSLLVDLQKKNLDIPFIITATHADFQQALELMRTGAQDIIETPSLFRLTQVLVRERYELILRRGMLVTQQYLEVSLKEIQFQKFALDQANIVSVTDANGIISYVNEKFIQVSGYNSEELVGKSHRILKSTERTKENWKDFWETIQKGNVWKGEIKNTKKNGSTYWVESTVIPFFGSDGSIFQYIAIQNDISDRKLAENQLTHDAFYDNLTGLPNRALFLVRIEQRIGEYNSKTSGYPIVLSINLDDFKRINHALGSEAGDAILNIFADRILKFSGPSATTTRIAADSFAVLLVDFFSIQEAYDFAVRLMDNLREIISYNGYCVFLTASCGAAGFGVAGCDGEEILKNAEIAMFHTKETRQGTVSIFTQEMKEIIHYQLEIQNDLRKAIDQSEFLVHYQPILDLSTNEIGHWEALVRWKHPKKGMISPLDFIPMAENSDLIVPITKYVLEEACGFIKAMKADLGKNISVAINLSPQVFQHQNIFHWISDVHTRLGIPYHSLQVEITESLAMKNMREIVPILENLIDIGVKVALDDFGTGYSSLSYLEKLPLSIVKIDKSFLDEILPGSKQSMLLISIIHMAHELGLKVIAEGVEEVSQFNLLREYRCDQIQGYLISKPLSSEDAKTFIQNFSGPG